ncbi:MAG: glycosyltransferase family 2 protein [Planctomycetota bacterium]
MKTVPDSELELTILMPCLNEAETLERCITKALNSLERLGISGEVLIADNGSTDGSQDLAKRLGARVVDIARKGYGAALMGGIESARGRFVIMGDSDDSYDFSRLEGFVEKLREGHDLVMGCRMPRGGGTVMPGAMPFKHRWLGNPVLTGIGRLFFHSPMNDFHCGLRGFSREAILRLGLVTTGMEFASEMVIKANFHRLKMAEVPITLHKDGRSRPPHLRSWRDGWRHLRFMLLYCPRWLFWIPGILMALVGGGFFVTLSFAPLHWGSVTFDTNTLLVSALTMLLGFQLMIFAMFTKVYGIKAGFLPEDPAFERLFGFFNLEKGLVASLAVFVLGLATLLLGVGYWAGEGFGNLDYATGLRLVIPAVTLILAGVQGMFSSFFLSILGIEKK